MSSISRSRGTFIDLAARKAASMSSEVTRAPSTCTVPENGSARTCCPETTRNALPIVIDAPDASCLRSISRRTDLMDCVVSGMLSIWLLRIPAEGISAWHVTLRRPPFVASPIARTVRVVPSSIAA